MGCKINDTVDATQLQAAFGLALRRSSESTGRERVVTRLSPIVGRLVAAIHEDLFEPLLSVQALKERCGAHDNNISCRFRREVGLSMKAYIDMLRLQTARQLLLDTSSSVFEVCQTVGYYHPQTFYRAFYRSFRCTPGDVRSASPNGGLHSPALWRRHEANAHLAGV